GVDALGMAAVLVVPVRADHRARGRVHRPAPGSELGAVRQPEQQVVVALPLVGRLEPVAAGLAGFRPARIVVRPVVTVGAARFCLSDLADDRGGVVTGPAGAGHASPAAEGEPAQITAAAASWLGDD